VTRSSRQTFTRDGRDHHPGGGAIIMARRLVALRVTVAPPHGMRLVRLGGSSDLGVLQLDLGVPQLLLRVEQVALVDRGLQVGGLEHRRRPPQQRRLAHLDLVQQLFRLRQPLTMPVASDSAMPAVEKASAVGDAAPCTIVATITPVEATHDAAPCTIVATITPVETTHDAAGASWWNTPRYGRHTQYETSNAP
jgi:hypothetical protein